VRSAGLRAVAELAPALSSGDIQYPLLVLGSASPARATLLRAAGITPVIWPSRVDEDALIAHAGDLVADPQALTQMLATAKARDVADQVRAGEVPGIPPGARVLVIGADSMLDFDGQVLGKARSAQEVRDRWATMSGQTGVLVTGHTVIDVHNGRLVEKSAATTIRFGHPDPLELEAYIASGEPLAVAGSCTIDGLGGAFIDGVDGDHSNVIGLGMPTLRGLLAELGVRWTDLWDRA
jgi:septum formation protein